MDLTIFEVHLDDASFTANAPFSGGEDEAELEEEEAGHGTEDGGGRPSIAPLFVGLLVFAAVAFGVRRMLRSDSEDVEATIGTDAETDEKAETEVHA